MRSACSGARTILTTIPRRLAQAACLSAMVSATAFAAPAPRPLGLATTAGFNRSRATLPPSAAKLANDDERIA